MASIFTGLAFMHGHIVDRELVLRLGRDEAARPRERSPQAAPRPVQEPAAVVPSRTACATC